MLALPRLAARQRSATAQEKTSISLWTREHLHAVPRYLRGGAVVGGHPWKTGWIIHVLWLATWARIGPGSWAPLSLSMSPPVPVPCPLSPYLPHQTPHHTVPSLNAHSDRERRERGNGDLHAPVRNVVVPQTPYATLCARVVSGAGCDSQSRVEGPYTKRIKEAEVFEGGSC